VFGSIADRAAAWGYLQAKEELFKSFAPNETIAPDIFYQ
jgi:hypothetical protein